MSYSLWLPVVTCRFQACSYRRVVFYSIFLEKISSNKKSFGLPGGNVNVMQNFCRSCLIIKATSCQKRSLCYKETETKPRSCRDSYSAYPWQQNHVLIECDRFYYMLYVDSLVILQKSQIISTVYVEPLLIPALSAERATQLKLMAEIDLKQESKIMFIQP